jgi:membrane associated rhomboid family serine protease
VDQDQPYEHVADDLAGDAQHCYRHPGRETGVSCSNCGRPICYECMTPAAVGFRCPECIAEQRRDSGRSRVITRGQIRGRWQGGMLGSTHAPVTRVLIGLNVAAFVIEIIAASGAGGVGSLSTKTLVDLGALYTPRIVVQHEYWRLVTAMFLHAGLMHIFFNMISLYFLGSYLEPVAGWKKFLVVYFTAGLAGNVLAFAIGPVFVPMIGASTAIFGLLGALFLYSLHNRHTFAGQALRSIGFWLVLNLVFTFLYSNISWQGHIGGLLGGIAAFEALTLGGRKALDAPFEGADLAAIVVVIGVIMAVAWWRVTTLTL